MMSCRANQRFLPEFGVGICTSIPISFAILVRVDITHILVMNKIVEEEVKEEKLTEIVNKKTKRKADIIYVRPEVGVTVPAGLN